MKLLFAIFLLLFVLQVLGQNENIVERIHKADSIVLIRHKITLGYAVVEPGKKSSAYPLLIKGDINPKVILRRKVILNRKQLIDILYAQEDLHSYTPSNCDEPRNSILIYKQGKLSYIDICFMCLRYHTSKDLQKEIFLDKKLFKKLEALFKSFDLI